MAGTGAKIGIVALVLVLGIVGVVIVLRQDGDDTGPESTVEDYLAAWSTNDTAAMADLVATPPVDFAERHQAVVDGLGVAEAGYEGGDITTDGDAAVAEFTATLRLEGLGEWSYEGTMELEQGAGEADSDDWLVNWSSATIHPSLTDVTSLARTREQPTRAPITDLAGQPLVVERPAVTIGAEPQRIQDRQAIKDALAAELGFDPAEVDARLDAAGVQPNHFVAFTTVSREQYDQVRDVVYPIPGLLFRETTLRAGPSDGFAHHVLGRVDDITAERLAELGPLYRAGDRVGMTGIEGRFETQLAGTPSGDIQVRDAANNPVEVVGHIEGTAPVPVATTLDPTVQAAIESGLAGVELPAAAVVVDSAGNIRGSASRPLSDGVNRALSGSYPPGSTFKVVTTSALLDAGVTPETLVECPPTVNAGGREFQNFEGGSLGTIEFGQAFAESCNTAFVNATLNTPGTDLVAAAQRFGFNAEYSVGLTTDGGSFPEPADLTEKAASVIGQGRVLASPLHMATVAAAVIDGTWEPPTLLPGQPAENPPAPTQLTPTTRDTLAMLMRRVVTEGSGTAADVAGTEVAGKTGTAEFGSGDPPPTHAWFIAFRGDLALALIIEGGGVGGRDAAPVAAEILAQLP